VELNPDNGRTITKPTLLASKIISLLGFKNPEDLIYALAQDYFQYMNTFKNRFQGFSKTSLYLIYRQAG
jgi:hypothetical protein